ncbi:MAG: VOC family protein [Nocardioides sp.]
MTEPRHDLQHDRFRVGEPAWIELCSAQPASAEQFYAELLGWTVRHERLGAGTYRMCSVDDHDVAGITAAEVLRGERSHGWITYFAVDDVDASLDRALQLGAETVTAPRYLPAAGTGCTLVDPQGAVFGMYHGDARAGVETANTPGSLCWTELSTGEPRASVEFYRGLFGYAAEHRDSVTGSRYSMLTLDGSPVAGILELESEWPNVLPARWAPYLAVADLSRAVDQVHALGGSQVLGPVSSPHGVFHVVRDAEGHALDLIQLEEDLWISPRLTPSPAAPAAPAAPTSTQVSDA